MAEIGAQLREARMRAKIDINEVEVRTKIRAKYLRAIENEEWDLLPGEVYVKSFLRTYGNYLGLDTRQLIDDFKRRYERPGEQELRPLTPLGRERERTRSGPRIPPWLTIVVVLVVVVGVLFLIGVGSKKAVVPAGRRAVLPHRVHRAVRQKALGRAPRAAAKVRLQLTATGQVYVCLVSGSGKKLIPGLIYNTGQTIPVHSATKLLLTLGNASIKIRANGAPVAVAPSSGSIGYEFLPSSHHVLSAATQPRCA